MATADTFTAALGPGRGHTGDLAHERLTEVARQLADAEARNVELLAENAALTAAVEELDETRHALRDADRKLNLIERFRDHALYAVMRAGGQLPSPPGGFEARHNGPWRPSRPYLPGSHVHSPRGICYRAGDAGAPIGAKPGKARVWVRCPDPASCPQPVLPENLIDQGRHPISNGFQIRQAEFWWDAKRTCWPLPDLADDHLQAIIYWLPEQLWSLEANEQARYTTYPLAAYETPEVWLADLPIMRALLAEQARRAKVSERRAQRQRNAPRR